MNRRSFIKGLIALASAPAIGKYVNVFKTEGAREGIEQVAGQGVDFFNMVIKKVMDEGTLVKEQDRISTFKHPDRPDITVDVDQTTGSSSVYFDTDQGTKAVGEIQKTMDETTGGKVVEELFEQEEIYGPTGRDAQEGISGGITNLEKFLKGKRGFAMGGRVGMFRGGIPKGLQAALQLIKSKFGDDAIKTADKVESKSKVFDDFEVRNPDPKRQMTDDEYQDFLDEIGGDQLEAYDFDGTIGDAKRILDEEEKYMAYMYNQYKTGKLDPVAGDKSPARKKLLQKRFEDMEASGDKRLMTREEIEELSTFDLGTQMDEIDISQGMIDLDELNFTKNAEAARIKIKYPGISDELIKKILIDDNPQRKAEVLATLDEAFKMMNKGKGNDEIIEIFKNTKRTKQADGGIIDLTAMKIPDNSKSGVESLFKRR